MRPDEIDDLQKDNVQKAARGVVEAVPIRAAKKLFDARQAAIGYSDLAKSGDYHQLAIAIDQFERAWTSAEPEMRLNLRLLASEVNNLLLLGGKPEQLSKAAAPPSNPEEKEEPNLDDELELPPIFEDFEDELEDD